MLRYCPNAKFDNASVIVGEPNKYFSPSGMAEFLNFVQKLSIDATGLPLFVSVDQEGSIRNDINRAGAFAYSGHMSFGAAADPAVAEVTVGCAEHKALSKKLAANSIITLKKKIILLKDEGQKVLVISVEPQKV